MFSRLILLFLIVVSNFTWGASDVAIIDDDNNTFNIAESGFFFIDKNKTLSFDEIQSSEYAKQFRPINRSFLQLGIVEGNIWVRSDIAIRTTTNIPVVLEVNSPRIQNLEIFLPTLYDNQIQAEFGSAHTYNSKAIKSAKYLFTLPTNTPAVFTVYFKLSSHLPVNAQIELKTLSKLSSDSQKDFIFTGVLIGVLLALFTCNIFFYIRSRNLMYLIYAGLLVSIIILHLALHDQISQFFPNKTGMQERIYNLSSFLCLSTIVFFSRLYLDTKQHLPMLDKVLLVIGSLNAFFAIIFSTAPESMNIVILSIMAVVTISTLTFHAIISCIKKIPFSGYYLAARSILLIGHLAWITSVYGLIPSATLLEWGLSVTIIIETLIHFTGMISQKSPLLQPHIYKAKHSQDEIFDLLSDLSSRLRRQINIIGGGITHLEQAAVSPDTKLLIASTQTANNNLKNLITRIDYLSDLEDKTAFEQTTPVSLNQLIDNAHHNFQRIDQDSALIEINTNKTDKVEILNNAQILQHLIEVLAEEFKHFTNQTLTINITHHDVNREGITLLEIECSPLPTRASTQTSSFDFGSGYIELLVQYLNGECHLSDNDQTSRLNIQIPIQSHIRSLAHRSEQQGHFDIILLGQEDDDLQKTLTLLQNYQNKIEHFATLESLLDHLNQSKQRTSGLIILVFDNGGHIPHITQQRLLPLMNVEDQCLLISNNVKMSPDYAKKLGFDEILPCSELDSQFKTMLSRLIQKGDRLKNTSLSRIKPLNKTP
ncbi:7TM diverse intracellular signaling domain-containing protein [Marinomonas sp. 2405UD66-6]|uniref:sensor histidine kinase n=1 Tax=Marinomonas sp. 2405UD66-6 TaxID=3391834 RepID=UPI0039C9A4A0